MDTRYQQAMGCAWVLLASRSISDSDHYGYLQPEPKPVAASVVLWQHFGQEEPADSMKPLHTDHIIHQSSFPFEIA